MIVVTLVSASSVEPGIWLPASYVTVNGTVMLHVIVEGAGARRAEAEASEVTDAVSIRHCADTIADTATAADEVAAELGVVIATNSIDVQTMTIRRERSMIVILSLGVILADRVSIVYISNLQLR